MAGTAERKLVTLLFADLTGYTALCEQLDAEAVHDVVNPAMSALRDLVVSYGGTPSAIAGDGFHATFGIPVAHEDDAARAVLAGLTLQPWVDAFNEGRRGIRLPDIHVGINTGEVVVETTGDGLGDFAMSGRAINIASRLCSLAVGGQVLVGAETAQLTPGVAFGPRRRRRIKGLPDLLSVHEALRTPVAGAVVAARGLSPFVNRVHELSVLERALEDVAVTARGSVLALVGDAGLGKSRLVQEFLDRHADCVVLRGACAPFGRQPPLAALVDALLTAAGTSRSAPATERSAALHAFADGLDVSPATVSPLVELAVGSGPGETRLPPRESLEAASHGALALVEALAGRGSTILVLDDVHWADADLTQLLADAVRHPWRGPVLVLALSRPDRPAAAHVSVEVAELPPAEMENLLTAVLGVRPPPYLDDMLLGRLAGNPLYLEECVRLLLESGTVRLDGAELKVRDRHLLAEVPTSLRMLIAARLDALPSPLRAAIRVASVWGMTTWDELLDAEHRPAVDGLAERDLLVLDDASVLPGARQLHFKHALIRDVAYESLPRRRRAELHLGAASRLREAAETHDDFTVTAELLAWHYEQAWQHGRQSGDQVDPVVARAAIEQLRVVAEQAFVFQARSAESAYARALDILGDVPDAVPAPTAARLRLGRATALFEMQQYDAVLEEVERVLARAPDGRARAEALLLRGSALSDQGATAAARESLAEARLEFGAAGDRRGEARVIHAESWTWRFADLTRFYETLASSREVFEEAGDLPGMTQVVQELAYGHMPIGGELARTWNAAARDLLTEADVRGQAAALRIDALTALYRGDFAGAARIGRDAGERAEECGQPWYRSDALMARINAAIALGQLDEAGRLAAATEELAQDLGLERLSGCVAVLAARIALRRAQPELAAERLRAARLALERLASAPDLADADLVDAEMLLDAQRPAEAAEAAARAVAVLRNVGWHLYALHAELVEVRALLLAGSDVARARLIAVAEAAELLDAPRHAALARAYAAQTALLVGEDVDLPPMRDDDPELVAVSAENAGLLAARDEKNTAVAKGYFATAVSAWAQLGESVWLRRARGWLDE